MSLDEDIVVMGDVHGEFGRLNSWVNKKRPMMILQCGDFGYWPHLKSKGRRARQRDRTLPKLGQTRLYWCCGNHEDHDSLSAIECSEVYPNCFYMRRGSSIRLPDGRAVLFIGGAVSSDRHHRTPGVDWFPEEVISEKDVENLPDAQIDIVISHTCPREFEMLGDDMKVNDSSRDALSVVMTRYRPQLWFFGHFHEYATGENHGCRWTALDMAGYSNWWVNLPARD